jgi:dihydrodipicolinate synthase/N-acetylneuraminate lyase
VAAGREGTGEQQRLDAAKQVLLQFPLIAASKSVLVRRGVDRMWVRPPLVDLTDEQEREIEGRLEDLGVL